MKTLTALIALALAGCASVAPSQSYRPANYAGPAWAITGSYNDLSGAVSVSIDGKQVAQGSVSRLSGDGEFFGDYEGRKVAVSCATSSGLLVQKTVCQVFVSGERAAALSF